MMNTQQKILGDAEDISVPSRRKRFFVRHGAWFFLSRNEQEHGPYTSLDEAKRQLAVYLDKVGVVRFPV